MRGMFELPILGNLLGPSLLTHEAGSSSRYGDSLGQYWATEDRQHRGQDLGECPPESPWLQQLCR